MHGVYARTRNSSDYTRGYTCSAWLNRFFKLLFFIIKQAKMHFVFKLFFLFHRVTNQNFKKSAKFLIINKGKIEGKNHRKKSMDDVIFPCYNRKIHSVHSRRSHGKQLKGTRGSILLALALVSVFTWQNLLPSLLFFSVCSKPKKGGDFSWIF